jgi:hypothetical protein
MSSILIFILIHHRQKPGDLISLHILHNAVTVNLLLVKTTN